jgi:hypothetical protein
MRTKHTRADIDKQKEIDAKPKPFEVPLILYTRGLEFRLTEKHPNYWRYVHYYDKGKWYECFDMHDLKLIERYG